MSRKMFDGRYILSAVVQQTRYYRQRIKSVYSRAGIISARLIASVLACGRSLARILLASIICKYVSVITPRRCRRRRMGMRRVGEESTRGIRIPGKSVFSSVYMAF